MNADPTAVSAPMIAARTVSLDNCDREQVQYPGAIQPHGALMTLRESDLTVLQVSANVDALLGAAPETLLGQNVARVLGEPLAEALRRAVAERPLDGPPEHLMHVRLRTEGANRAFEAFAHRRDGVLILELETAGRLNPADLSGLYGEVRRCVARLQATRSTQAFFDAAVLQIRRLTAFDRVHVYQLLDDGSGLVRAESCADDRTSYLGLRFPATDVPEPARRLLGRLWFRHMPDAAYRPAPLIPELNPLNGAPLDLSHALLRSTSALCNRFYLNMGVRATLILTLRKDDRLWGFVGCHHAEPKAVPHEIREACESLAHMISLSMSAKEEAERAGEALSVRLWSERLIQQMAQEDLYHLGLLRSEANLREGLDAAGAAIRVGEGLTLLGRTPDAPEIAALCRWLETQGDFFATDRLPELYPPAEAFKTVAVGLLAIRLAEGSGHLLWFRPEQIHEIRWAGDPVKPVEIDARDGLARLGPRRSFDIWRQTVRGRSRPWLAHQIEAAAGLGQAMRVLHRAERLARANRTLARCNEELESFAFTAAHDLKEPLRGIGRYSERLRQNLGNALPEDERNRLGGILRLTRRMDELVDALLNYSRLGRAQLSLRPADLNLVVQEALDFLRPRLDAADVEIVVQPNLPVLLCDPVRIHEVFANLIANAVKYNDRSLKRIELGASAGAEWTFYVKDNGIGIDPAQCDAIFEVFRRLHGRDAYGGGSGAGLAIVKKVVELHGGRVWAESTPGSGATFFFTLPDTTADVALLGQRNAS